MHKRIETEVNIFDVKLDVTGNYHPPEPVVYYDNNMEGYPGSPAEFEIKSVEIGGILITELLSNRVYELIVEQVIEKQQS
jgi:hypothetical protein